MENFCGTFHFSMLDERCVLLILFFTNAKMPFLFEMETFTLRISLSFYYQGNLRQHSKRHWSHEQSSSKPTSSTFLPAGSMPKASHRTSANSNLVISNKLERQTVQKRRISMQNFKASVGLFFKILPAAGETPTSKCVGSLQRPTLEWCFSTGCWGRSSGGVLR